MSEMIERVARAICEARGWNPDAFRPPLRPGDELVAWPDHAIPLWVQVRKDARAVIEAMRAPTAAMIDVAVEAEFPAGDLGADEVAALAEGAWRAMISEALKG